MRRPYLFSIACLWLLAGGTAEAGMTVVTLTDVAAARLEALSFFLFTYLVISWVAKLIWNQLVKSFASLPRLKYREALGVVFVTGLLLDSRLWNFGDGGLYCLVPGVKPGGGREVLVYEPSMAGGRRFVLLADGSIEDRAEGDLKRELDKRIER